MPNRALELAEELAKPFESLRLDCYHDPVGFPTQGWGRLMSREKWADLKRWPDIDRATADRWLGEDMTKAQRAVHRLITAPLTDNQEAALIDFTFNCGGGNLEISTLRRLVNRLDYLAAADEFPKWVYAGPVKLAGLVRRRKAERELFLS